MAAATEKQIEAGTWGVFFVWVGIALAAHLGWGIGLIGIGAIILGGQAARGIAGLGAETFWMIAAVIFVAAGIWAQLRVQIAFVPIVCIIAGVALFVSALVRGRRAKVS